MFTGHESIYSPSTIQGKIYGLVTIGDVYCALQGRKNKTHGLDGAQYSYIKFLGEEFLGDIGDVNVSIKTFNVPENWLHSYLK